MARRWVVARWVVWTTVVRDCVVKRCVGELVGPFMCWVVRAAVVARALVAGTVVRGAVEARMLVLATGELVGPPAVLGARVVKRTDVVGELVAWAAPTVVVETATPATRAVVLAGTPL